MISRWSLHCRASPWPPRSTFGRKTWTWRGRARLTWSFWRLCCPLAHTNTLAKGVKGSLDRRKAWRSNPRCCSGCGKRRRRSPLSLFALVVSQEMLQTGSCWYEPTWTELLCSYAAHSCVIGVAAGSRPVACPTGWLTRGGFGSGWTRWPLLPLETQLPHLHLCPLWPCLGWRQGSPQVRCVGDALCTLLQLSKSW
jgi:hypothetical protein